MRPTELRPVRGLLALAFSTAVLVIAIMAAPLWWLFLLVPACLVMTINVALGGGFNDKPDEWYRRISQLRR
jgi:membrane protease YdiL (CAAX protease family)